MRRAAEKFLSENDDKLPDEIKAEVRSDLDDLKKLLEDPETDSDAFTAAITKLGESSQKMGAAIYAATEAASAAEGTQTGEPGAATGEGDDDVVDAEIVDEETTDTKGEDGESK